MRTYLRYSELKARGVVKNRTQLKHMIDSYGFPRGRLLSPNVRVWTDTEVDEYIDSRPIEPKPVPKSTGRPKGRPRKANHAGAEA
jgi:predicted DNA-binding transcriptional regulator AlpA